MLITLTRRINLARNMSLVSSKRKAEETDGEPSKTKKRILMRANQHDSEYYFQNGLRKVYPYKFTFHAFCKRRWIGSKLFDVYTREFRGIGDERLTMRFEKGYIKVNEEMVSPDYVLKDNDLITGMVHRHELAVIGLPLKIVHEDDNVIVVDKPPSLPIHSCGRFHLNTLASILRKEHNIDNIRLCHRLDRLTSGLVILAKNTRWARKIIDQITQRVVTKEYVCKVEGEFPEGEVKCDKPLHPLCHKIGLQIVHEDGKESSTVFNRISTNGKTSLVKCTPKTGRTHQIRVHLQYLGYPIANDPLYNHSAFGPIKGTNGDYGEGTLDDLKERVYAAHPISHYINAQLNNAPKSDENVSLQSDEKNHEDIMKLSELVNKTVDDDWRNYMKSHSFDSSKLTTDPDCEECKVSYKEPTSNQLLIYLHCLRYKGIDFEYETDLPFWAKEEV